MGPLTPRLNCSANSNGYTIDKRNGDFCVPIRLKRQELRLLDEPVVLSTLHNVEAALFQMPGYTECSMVSEYLWQSMQHEMDRKSSGLQKASSPFI